VAVHQWAAQFRLWTKLEEKHICVFTKDRKSIPTADAVVLITTYHMVGRQAPRAAGTMGAEVMNLISSKEWGKFVFCVCFLLVFVCMRV
jgi:DNA excision repair protein ERCC-3